MDKILKSIENMMDKLTCCMEKQIDSGIENVDTKEAGYVVDMIKDLADACYHVVLVEAMGDSEYGKDYNEYGPTKTHDRDSGLNE